MKGINEIYEAPCFSVSIYDGTYLDVIISSFILDHQRNHDYQSDYHQVLR